MDAYRRLSRCTSFEMVEELAADLKDAFGEPPRQFVILQALTELKLLAGHYGVESIIKQPPDVILKLRDAARVQEALTGAPGSLRIVDERTLYFRPPQGYLEPEVLLMVLRNLMHAAYQREQKASAQAALAAVAAPTAPEPLPARDGKAVRPSSRPSDKPKGDSAAAAQLEKLASLRSAGILTDAEFEAARRRLLP
jgi:hypothetical protein